MRVYFWIHQSQIHNLENALHKFTRGIGHDIDEPMHIHSFQLNHEYMQISLSISDYTMMCDFNLIKLYSIETY